MRKGDSHTVRYIFKDIKLPNAPSGSGKTRSLTANIIRELQPIGEIVARKTISKAGVRIQKLTKFY